MSPVPRQTAPDADWIGGLYDAHGARLFGYALLILADRAAAEDAVQQVFSSILESRLARESILSPGDYLRRAVRNECYTILRRRRHAATNPEDGRLVEARPGQAADADDRIAVSRALGQLPAEQREVVHLKAFEGMTFAEIGTVLGIPANTAASRYRYALARLRDVLAPADDIGSRQS